MASTYTPSNRLRQIGTGDLTNTWGIAQNANTIAMIDEAMDGYIAIVVVGDMTLTSLNGVTDQSRPRYLKLNGSPAANFTLTTPNVSKLYRVWNNSGRIATFTTGAGTTVAIDSGDIIDIQCDGTNWTTPGVGGLSWKAYISAVAAGGAGTLPSVIGQSGKFLTNNGTLANWSTISALQLSDYSTNVLGVQVALAASL